MTRKDFNEAATLLRQMRMEVPTDDWVAMMLFCIKLFKQNPRFDEAKFREACYE